MSKDLLKNLISDLDKINKDNVTPIFIPSLDKKVEFEMFSVAQHKDLLKSAFEGYEGAIKSNIIYNNAILDNSVDDIDFSVADRAHILVELRKSSLGNNYVVDDKTLDMSKLPTPNFEFNYTQKLEYNGVVVKLKIPSLERDTAISKKLLAEFKRLSESEKDVEAVNVMITYEIIKYIDSVEVADNTITFDNFNLYESKQIVNTLPLKINNAVVDFIDKFKQQETANLTFDDDTFIEIDAGFLSND